ncbi:MAG TPA: cobyric acid synthase [Nitrospira sp.]|nr:cobyric acid synthase [Nitrospira sp.]
MRARTLMIQGTASHVGKSVVTAALCRLFVRRGLRVAPFKAQNMSNNSFVTPDGKEIGRAQAVQAAACRLAPRADFNPILIKPESDKTAQLVVGGEVAGSLSAKDFGFVRRECWTTVQHAFRRLSGEFDLVVLEGAGSPAEVNLRRDDVVNMHMAQEAAAPVLLVGDIERGGVFASIVGTCSLLDDSDRRHLKAFLINKFRGEAALLREGLHRVSHDTGLPCAGMLPYCNDVTLPEEDALGWDRWPRRTSARADRLTIGIADVPGIANFTDFEPLAGEPDVEVRPVNGPTERPLDALIFPGAKHTVRALRFIREQGLDTMAHDVLAAGGTVGGVCAGYQLLGRTICDPDRLESEHTRMDGLGMLPVNTTFAAPKIVEEVSGRHLESGCAVTGYHVRMGRTHAAAEAQPLLELSDAVPNQARREGLCLHGGRLFGTSLHGLFDQSGFRRWWLNRMRASKGWIGLAETSGASLDARLDRLADFVEEHLDMSLIDRLVKEGV